ncbi:MAG: hypothetical protein WCR22_05740 [Bacteroidales bacterium]
MGFIDLPGKHGPLVQEVNGLSFIRNAHRYDTGSVRNSGIVNAFRKFFQVFAVRFAGIYAAKAAAGHFQKILNGIPGISAAIDKYLVPAKLQVSPSPILCKVLGPSDIRKEVSGIPIDFGMHIGQHTVL